MKPSTVLLNMAKEIIDLQKEVSRLTPIVKKIQQDAFVGFLFYDDANDIITDPEKLYLSDDDELANFNELLPPPTSAGVEQTKSREGFGTTNQLSSFVSPVNNNSDETEEGQQP